MRCVITLMVFSLFLNTGCGKKGPRNIGVIIDSTGKYPVNGMYVSNMEVKSNDEGKLRLWLERANLPVAGSTDLDLLEGWFIYAESQTRFWVFNGDETLELWEYSGSPGNERSTNKLYAQEEIPEAILFRLPESLKPNEVNEQDAGGKVD